MTEPRKPRPIPPRIHLRELKNLVRRIEEFIVEMDAIMRTPSTYQRGVEIGKLVERLEIAKDAAKRAGLGEDGK